jgi:hypothetical protein
MAARATMADLIQRVRELTGAGTAEYSIGAVAYWSDEQIEAALDRARLDVWGEQLTVQPQYAAAGSVVYRVYNSRYANYEQTAGGTALFIVRDGTGATVGTALYTADYTRGVVTFGTTTNGDIRTLEGRAFDVYGAAADVLDGWAGYLARQFDFATDGQSFKLSQQREALEALAARYRAQAKGYGQAGLSGEWERSDLNPVDTDLFWRRYE